MEQLTMEELTAVYLHERHRFTNANGDVIIAQVRPVDATENVAVKGPDDDHDLVPRLTYRFYGQWSEYFNKRLGATEKQFHYRTYVEAQPYSQAGIIRYLSQCNGIGARTATNIWNRFKADAVRILREQPEVVAAGVPRLSVAKATEASQLLREKFGTEACMLELMELFDGRGFPKDTGRRVAKKWGNEGARIIKRDPYKLLGKFPGCGFKRCDALYLDLGLPPGRLKRQALCAWYACQNNSSGDTWIYVDAIRQAIRESIGGTDARPDDAIRLTVRAGLLASCWTDGTDGGLDWDGDCQWLAITRKAKNERTVAAKVNGHPRGPQWPDVYSSLLSDHQTKLINQALSSKIGILGGSPGTGKTYTAARLIASIIDNYGASSIAVAAPTGKAAVRITESLQQAGIALKAKTWHSLLKVASADDGAGWSFEHGEDNPLPYRFLISDESSMIDTDLMAAIMRALSAETHLLFVGDVNQLAPVGHGAPLRDMIAAGVPYGELTEIRRNSGRIVEVCAAIRDRKPWEPGGNLSLVEASGPDWQIQRMIEQLESQDEPVWGCQVIVPVNKKSRLARKVLNEVLQERLNQIKAIRMCPFRIDDKVVNTSNSWLSPAENINDDVETNDNGQVYVANGEIGRVIDVTPKYLTVELWSPNRVVRVPRGKPEDSDNEDATGTGCSWDLAYAISCHKSQGSEWPVVLVMLDEYPGAMRVATREWLYTAISRAKKQCVLIGKKETADAMCRKVAIGKRKTFLMELIDERTHRSDIKSH